MDLGLLPLLAVIVLVPLVLHQRRRQHDRLRASESADRHAALVEQTGLVPREPDAEERHALTGTIEGIAVSLRTRDVATEDGSIEVTVVRAALPPSVAGMVRFCGVGTTFASSLPTFSRLVGRGGIELDESGIDQRLDIRGPDPALVRAVLADPALREVLEELADVRSFRLSIGQEEWRRPWELRVEHDAVVAVSLGEEDLQRMVADAAGIARRLVDRGEAVLAQRAEALGLTVAPGSRGTARRFEGRRDGVEVRVQQDEGTTTGAVTATVAAPALPDLVVQPRADAAGAPPPLGDLILDRMVAVHTADRDTARDRLTRDDARAALLTVVPGRAGATVEGGRVVVPVPDLDPETLAAAVADAVALARELGA